MTKFGLTTFPQYSSGAMLVERFRLERASSYKPSGEERPLTLRFQGGVQSLIDKIQATLPKNSIRLQAEVTQIVRRSSSGILLRLKNSQDVYADTVILTLPPRLIARNIVFDPPLSPQLLRRLLEMPTWVGAQAKAIALYSTPFWRAEGFSGMASSFIGPLQEMHDASSPEGAGALMGFSALTPVTRKELGERRLRELILAQLGRLFGQQARTPIAMIIKDWAQDPLTAAPDDWNPSNGYPVYGLPAEQRDQWDGQLVFAGSEFSDEHGGYLEGAISSAESASRQVDGSRLD